MRDHATIKTNHLSQYIVTVGEDYSVSIKAAGSSEYAVALTSTGGTFDGSDVQIVIQYRFGAGKDAKYISTMQDVTKETMTILGYTMENGEVKNADEITVWVVSGNIDLLHIMESDGTRYDHATIQP